MLDLICKKYFCEQAKTENAHLLYRSTGYISMFDIGPQGIHAHINTHSSSFKFIYRDFFHFNQPFFNVRATPHNTTKIHFDCFLSILELFQIQKEH